MRTRWWHCFRSPRLRTARPGNPTLSLEALEVRLNPAPLSAAPPSAVSIAFNNVNATPAVTNAFVNDLYLDVLFHAPDATGYANLTGQLNNSSITGGQAFASLVNSADYQKNVAPVLSLYETFLNRPAEHDGAAFWVNTLNNGATLGQVAQAIISSKEGLAVDGNLAAATDAQYVNFLYTVLYKRTPGVTEAAFWVNQLSAGTASRGDVAAAFVQAPELARVQPQVGQKDLVNSAYLALWSHTPDGQFASLAASLGNGTIKDAAALGDQFLSDSHAIGTGLTRNYLLGVFEGVLGRDPDLATYRALRNQLLNLAVTDKDALANLLQTAEFQNGILPTAQLYEVFLGRTPEAFGQGYWDGVYRGGASAATVAQGIAQSTEFKALNGDVLPLSPTAFVNFLYSKTLKRTGSANEVSMWVGRLSAGAESYGSLMVKFAQSPESQQVNGDLVNGNTAIFATRALLGHDPDAGTRAQEAAALKSGSLNVSGLAGTLMRSTEYAANGFGQNIGHYVVVYQENWSFDGLYGKFPGANGFANAGPTIPQVDKNGNPISTLPQPTNSGPDNRFPPGNGQPALPVAPYDATKYIGTTDRTGDIVHHFYTEQLQIDNGVYQTSNGKQDKFVAYSDNPGLTFSYFDATNLPEGQLAQQYTLDDDLFHSAYGGSFLNAQWLIAAASPVWNQPLPTSSRSFVSNTSLSSYNDGNLTDPHDPHARGDTRLYAVNTTFGAQAPHPSSVPADQLLQPLNDSDPTRLNYTPTIGDRLSAGSQSWKWYSGGWDNALAGKPDALFQFHHQAFAYYQNFAPFMADGRTLNPATTGPDAHLQDETRFFTDVRNGTLPEVSFIKPLGPENEHPGYASLQQGQQHVATLVTTLQNSTAWGTSSVVITYDENGGRWDHVPAPMVDRWGVGTRVPSIVLSPFANRGFVDHTQYETDSILATIEQSYRLQALTTRDAAANPMYNSYTFSVSDLIRNNG
jgi:phospholipase C